MKKRNLVLFGGLFALGALGAMPDPAAAQGISVRIGTPGYYGRPVYDRPSYRPVYDRPYRPVYVRPVRMQPRAHYGRPAYYSQDEHRPFCAREQYWDGYGWVRKRRTC